MGLIKYFFSLNQRGSPIVVRAFLAEPTQTVMETFYNKITQDNPPPSVFRYDNLNFAYVFQNQIYFAVATEESMSPSLL